MDLLAVITLLLACWDATAATMLYGPCPHLLPNTYESFVIKPFEGSAGQILYFSNVRFEALFDGRTEIEERYRSYYMIALEQQDDQCFRPFRLEKNKTSFAEVTKASTRHGRLTLINVAVLALHEKSYLLAFSCVQVGHNKLEYVWVFGRAGRFGVGREKVREMFGPWLANISTPYQDLRRTHHELTFCTSIFWPAMVGGVAALLTLLSVTSGIVCWKKHKQILQLRRSSCAEYPMEELEHPMELQDTENRRDITSAKTIAVIHGGVI
uniref:Uncharacterized protein n=1 Tax=Anopheles atroparvus TaxID=41427 RepID=A0A182JHI4_ANOAO